MLALAYIQANKPEHASNIDYIRDDAGNNVPHIQLPCTVPRINPETGNEIGSFELAFLYVVKGIHGRHLYCGQDYPLGMYFTRYDGLLVHSNDVTNPTWIRSLSYKGWAIDGRGNGEHSQMENNSLGHIANHSSPGSVARYSHRQCRAPVSGYCESIFVTARRDGSAWTEITANYTAGSAARDHNIPRVRVVPGDDYLDSKDLTSLPSLVLDGAQVLRKQCGFDLHRVCGHGSYGVVFAVTCNGESWSVKLSKVPYRSGRSARLLVEAALMDFAAKFHQENRHPEADAQAIGPFTPRLRRWNGYPALLVDVNGQRLAAVAMELADCSAREIFNGLGERFRAYHQENQCLLLEVGSVLKGILTVVRYMHATDLAHGDLKPGNILLRKLTSIPLDPLVAHCTVQGQIYQIMVCDLGLARWSGKGGKAVHVFSRGGKEHTSNEIDDLAMTKNPVAGVGLRELQTAFGLNLRNAHQFRHPGLGTEWIQAPDCSRSESFEKGEGVAQRRFDQAGDIWSVGATFARYFAAPRFSTQGFETEMRTWKARLIESSKRAYDSGQAAIEAEAKRRKLQNSSLPFGSSRAVRAAAAAVASAEPCFSAARPGLWLEAMVREHYAQDPGEFLSPRINGTQGARWRLLLELMQKLLSYGSEDRWEFAGQALQHPFFAILDPDVA
jgi:serine/threonine protein kinase